MIRLIFALLFALAPLSARAQFDHSHQAWNALLKRHAVLIEGGKASQVRYAGFACERAELKGYLASLSAATQAQFDGWTKPQQLAFLINAYNAFTIEKILSRYPDIRSIWDFGTIFGNPFKDRFFTLLEREMSLDGIEHGTIRMRGGYDEPRIHFAVNCASIGCPMLREEAYVAERLDRQLEEQTQRFLSDRSRNRYSAENGSLEVSKIFGWYKEDFNSGLKGVNSSEQFFGKYAQLLAENPRHQNLVRDGRAAIMFLEYDWRLNDARR